MDKHVALRMSTGEAIILTAGNDIGAAYSSSTMERAEPEDDNAAEFNAAMDAVESLLLSLFCEGVITPDNAEVVSKAVEGTVIAIAQNYA
jgi:hypothetical protein